MGIGIKDAYTLIFYIQTDNTPNYKRYLFY